MEKEKLSYKVQMGQFYYKGSVQETLQGIDEAINEDQYDEEGLYINVLRGVIQCERLDILEKIYNKCKTMKYVYKELRTELLTSIFIKKNESMINFLIDQKLPFESIAEDISIQMALPHLSIELLDKIHKNSYNLTDKNLNLLTRVFAMSPINEKKLDYCLSIGLNFHDDYNGIVHHSFSSYREENENRINYLIKNNVDLSNKNSFLYSAIYKEDSILLDKIIEQKVPLLIEDNRVGNVLAPIVRNDNVDFLNTIVTKGIKFNLYDENLLEYILISKAKKVLNYFMELGLDIDKVKQPNIKILLEKNNLTLRKKM